jgi:hypothetical protein
MFQTPYTPPLIEVPISDYTLGAAAIKRRARFVSLLHHQAPDGSTRTIVTVAVGLYDDQGQPVTGNNFQTFERTIATDNDTVVDMATGTILRTRTTELPAEWNAVLDAYTQPVMLQSDYFVYLRENHPLLIADLIRSHIANADKLGRFS